MKKLLKNKKALSPVVAAIILIAVTVAVSIAVAAWMGSMTFTFMETEEMTITKATFSSNNQITLTVLNTGSTDITLVDATISGNGVTGATVDTGDESVPVSSTTTAIGLTLDGTETYNAGSSYLIKVITSKGNSFTITATA